MKKRVLAFVLACLMLLMQVPFTAFAEETTTETTNTLTPDVLENGAEDIRYYQSFTYNGSAHIKSVKISEGALPEGVYLNSPSWTWFSISGTPTTMGTYSFTIEVKNENNEVLTKKYTLTIDRDYPLEIATDHLNRGYEGSAYTYNYVHLTYQRETNNKWELDDADGKGLPEGLTIDEDTGDISWPNPKAGKYNLKITVTRKEKTISKVLKLLIEPEGGCPHTSLTKTAGKTATCKENGTRDYWYCDDCEYYFLDEECAGGGSEYLGEIYTTAFHSDKNDDGKCDTCNKAMPIFKKVTSEDEITSCGMYLVVSKIGDKYYTFKAPENDYADCIEAMEITQNADGTFSYPETDTGVMILKTEFAAECGSLDAGKPRYSFGTTINGVPYCISSDDYSGSIQMYSYENSKYGYRMSLPEGGTLGIASVYSEYWGSDSEENSGECGILTAFEGTKDDTTKRFYSFRTKESYENSGIYEDYGDNYFYDTLSSYPIELYKLTYSGNAKGQNYTLSDAQSMVTINNEFTALDSVGSKGCSTVGGISEAVATSYVEGVISGQTEITGEVSVTTYADINLKSGESSDNEWGGSNIDSIVYDVTPKIEVKGVDSETTYTEIIDDKNFDGSEITLTLCVGDMTPAQIIHHKTDGTDEYFYNEHSEGLKSGQKTFSIDYGNENGNFVTFTVDSFSDIEILATAKAEPITTGNAAVTAPVAGGTPDFTAVSDDSSRYSVELLSWIDVENNKSIYPQDLTDENSDYYNYKFEVGKQYTVKVRFTAVGDYELSANNNFTINGEKTDSGDNSLERTYTFTVKIPDKCTNTAVDGNKFTVTGTDYIKGCTVVLALYKDDDNELVDCQNAVYNGEPISFTTIATDYTSARVMVLRDLESIEPVTGVENVKLK